MVLRLLNISKILGKRHSALLFGARGVGKTKLAEAYLDDSGDAIRYDLLEFDTFERLLKDPSIFRLEVAAKLKTTEHLVVFVDEIQKVPALLDEVHGLIEQHKGRLQFLLTGSSARKLKRSGVNLLAGRAVTLRLHPISWLEDELPLAQVLRLGSLPGVIYDNDIPERTLRSYVETYLKEEIQQEALVRRLDAFAKFLEIAAQYHGDVINMSRIADSAGVSSHTIREYFDILEDTLLGWRVPGWSASARKQLRTAPKFYFFDNGVCNALRGELGIEMRAQTARYGNLFEAWVVQEIMRALSYLDLDLKVSYWQTSSGLEVDVVFSRGAGQPLAAMEIKSSTKPTSQDLRGLQAFAEEHPKARRWCLCQTPRPYEMDGVDVVPWRDLFSLLPTI
jgi:predicted AAA+ superfamily ATPase